jgi:hypothetical protein
VESKRVV